VSAVAKILGVSTTTIYNKLSGDWLPYKRKIGGLTMVDLAALTEEQREAAREILAKRLNEFESDWKYVESVLKLQIETLKAENEALAQQLTEAEAAKAAASEGSEEAPLTYEETSRRLGDILLKANMDADRIVAEAEKEAASHLSGAEREADDIRLDATVTARLMTDRVKRRLTELTGEYIASLEAFSATSAEEYRKICEELKIKLGAANLDTVEILRDLKK
jgi:hypothetical protein